MSRRGLLAVALVALLSTPVLVPASGLSGDLERPLTIRTADGEQALFDVDLRDRIVLNPTGTERSVQVGTATSTLPGEPLIVSVRVEDTTAGAIDVEGTTVAVPTGVARPLTVQVDCGAVRPATGSVGLRVRGTGQDVRSTTTHDLTVACRAPSTPTDDATPDDADPPEASETATTGP